MTVRLYQSTDASAPTIYGAVGASNNLINLLTKILVTGYGSQAAAGWAKPYTGTNVACFKQAGAGGQYLAVNDSAALYSRVIGYETMTSATAGTGPYPTAALLSGGGYVHNSITNDTTARQWVCIADSTFFCLVIDGNDLGNTCQVLMFGDALSYRASDAYHKLLVCGTTATFTSSCVAADVAASITTAVAGHWMARSYTQLGSAITLGQHSDSIKATLAYPHPVDGGLYLGPLWLHENNLSVVRGVIRGVWIPLHSGNRPLAHGDTFSGTGALAGKTFLVQYVNYNKSLFLETSDTW